MNDSVWETFDGLFKTMRRQALEVEELKARVSELERRLGERAASEGESQDEQRTVGAR